MAMMLRPRCRKWRSARRWLRDRRARFGSARAEASQGRRRWPANTGVMTMAVPSASESGTSRRGFFTSPAVKVMLFQASAEKSEPTWATPKATKRPKAPPAAVTVGIQERRKSRRAEWSARPATAQIWEKLAWIAAALRPIENAQRRSSPTRASVFAEVKIFWMYLPRRTPRVFATVRTTISRMPTNCCHRKAQRVFCRKGESAK